MTFPATCEYGRFNDILKGPLAPILDAIQGVTSAGMLLCSSNEDHTKVEPLCPPEGVPVGELVTFEGHSSSPVEAGNRAGKAWKKVSKTLAVDETKVRVSSSRDTFWVAVVTALALKWSLYCRQSRA